MTKDAIFTAYTQANTSSTWVPRISYQTSCILQMIFVTICITFLLFILISKHPAGKRLADASSRWFTGRYTRWIVIVVMSLSMIKSIVKLLQILFAKE
jgi:hypothetical protein